MDIKTVFIGGSKTIQRLPISVCEELNVIIKKQYRIVIGDCRGVDTLVQQYLHKKGYRNVTVYVSGDKVRNNIGDWAVSNVSVSPDLSPFEFYRQKDIAMVEVSDFGIMVWNGRSKGTYHNIWDLHERDKEVKIIIII